MINFKKIIRSLALMILVIYNAQAQDISDNTQFSLLTVGTASESHSLYGHTAIRVKDTQYDIVFNYGMFDFSTPNFALRFVKGDMQYFAAAYDYIHFENNYRAENRTIWEQELILNSLQKTKLLQALNQSLLPENKYYTYKFIDRNCTTKALDIINQAIAPDSVIKKNTVQDQTYREVLNTYLESNFFLKLGINIMFGTKVDEVADKIFLPDDLMKNLDLKSANNSSIATETTVLFQATPLESKSYLNSILTLVVILAVLIISNKKTLINTYIILAGILGVILLAMSGYSLHEELWSNYNALLFNPLYLIALYSERWQNKNWKKFWYTLIAINGISYIIIAGNGLLAIMWPFILAHTFIIIKKIKQ